MEDNKGTYKVSMHGSTLTTLNVLIALWQSPKLGAHTHAHAHPCPWVLGWAWIRNYS